MRWLEGIKDGIKSQNASVGVFLLLIGRRWMSSMIDRAHAAYINPAEDYVILEIEFALRSRPSIEIIPLLVGEVAAPSADKLPNSIRALAGFEAALLRHNTFDADVQALVDRIDGLARSQEG